MKWNKILRMSLNKNKKMNRTNKKIMSLLKRKEQKVKNDKFAI